MILADTNIWIEYFRLNKEYLDDLNLLMRSKYIIVFEPVFAELIYGVRHMKDRERIRQLWNLLPRIETHNGMLIDAAAYANTNNFHNKGIGIMDAIIIKAVIDNKLKIWTLDKRILQNLPSEYQYRSEY